MSGKIKYCKPPFLVYHLPNAGYIGVTTNFKKRLYKHTSMSNYDVAAAYIIASYPTLDIALNTEEKIQRRWGFKTSLVRDQQGRKNPAARTVLHTLTGIYFDTIKDACECCGYSYNAVRHAVINSSNKYNLIRL